MTTVHNQAAFRQLSGERQLSDVTFDACSFDNCRVRGGTFTNVHFTQARTWACGLDQVVLRDCTVDGLQMSLGGSGGKTMPLFLYGVLVERVVLRGRVGSLIWNPPGTITKPVPDVDAVRRAAEFYSHVDGFALDVTDAEFTAIPSLRYGPPGHLVRHDPTTQQLVDLATAQRLLASEDPDLGVWGIVLANMVRLGWPESTVLIPATRAPKKQRERHAAALAHLRSRLLE